MKWGERRGTVTCELRKYNKLEERRHTRRDKREAFNEIEEREKSLFVTLTYPNEVKKSYFIELENGLELNFFNQVIFVALKNVPLLNDENWQRTRQFSPEWKDIILAIRFDIIRSAHFLFEINGSNQNHILYS